MTRPLREVIAETLQGIGGLALCNEPLSSFDDSANEVADKIIAALPQTEGSGELAKFAEMVRDLPIKNETMPHGVWLDGKKHTGPLADWFCGEFLPKLKDAARQALAPPAPDRGGEG